MAAPPRPKINVIFLDEEDAPPRIELAVRPFPYEGVRERLQKWWFENENSMRVWAASLGINPLSLLYLMKDGVPSLHTALALECLTDGLCDVYSWIDTEEFRNFSLRKVRKEAATAASRKVDRNWPPIYSDDIAKRLRFELMKRLVMPSDNALHVVTNMGPAEIFNTRKKKLAVQKLNPINVDEDASEEEVERARYRRGSLEAKRAAYRRGTRGTPD